MAKDNFRRMENGLRFFQRKGKTVSSPCLGSKVYTTYKSFYVRVYLFRILQDHYSAEICDEDRGTNVSVSKSNDLLMPVCITAEHCTRTGQIPRRHTNGMKMCMVGSRKTYNPLPFHQY